MNDVYGDGICCSYGNADHIYVDQVTITASLGGTSFAAATVGSSSTIKELSTPNFDTYIFDLDEDEFATDLVIYPNPARDILKIQSADQIAAVKVYNMSGALMQNITVIDNEIDVSR